MKTFIFKFFLGILILSHNVELYAQSTESTYLGLGLTINGYLPKVFEVSNNSESDLYNKAKKWANTYYPNIENELIFDSVNYQIKIRSIKLEAFYLDLKRNLFDVDYTLIMSFKQDKYRLQVELNAFFYNPRNTKYRSEGETQQTGWDQREFYLSANELDPEKSIGYSELNMVFYEISTSLNQAMKKELEVNPKSEDDW